MKRNELFNQLNGNQQTSVEYIGDGLLNDNYLRMLSKRTGFYSDCEVSDIDDDNDVITLSVTYGIQNGEEDWSTTDEYDIDLNTMKIIEE